jgi:hypothetical protein
MNHNHWLNIANHDLQPLIRHTTIWFTTTALSIAHHGELCWASGCQSYCVMLGNRMWIMVSYDGPVFGNHVLLYWANGYESWCVILSQWLWIIVSDVEPMAVNHGVLCWAEWLWIILWYAEPVVVNHCLLCWVCSCDSWFITMVHNQLLSITHYDSQPLAQ